MVSRSYQVIFLIVLLVAVGSCGSELPAEEPGKWDGDWASTIDSGNVFLLEARGSSVLASTDQGLLVSVDDDEYFEDVRSKVPGLGDEVITGIVLRTDRWFIASNQGKVWESTSSGFSWTQAGTLPQQTEVRLSASGEDLIAALKTGRVYRSTDYGKTWNLSDSGITAAEVRTVFYHSALLLAAPILEPVLYRSTDFGETWSPTDSGYDGTAVTDFTAAGKDIYAAAGDKGVFHSTNKGISWEPQINGFPARMYASTIHLDKKVVYVGGVFTDIDQSNKHVLYRSLDYGKKWDVSDEGLPPGIEEVTSVAATNNFIVLGTRGKGIWRRKKG
jgi:photosystem II stability/assembly factor-like uncharacterized protein